MDELSARGMDGTIEVIDNGRVRLRPGRLAPTKRVGGERVVELASVTEVRYATPTALRPGYLQLVLAGRGLVSRPSEDPLAVQFHQRQDAAFQNLRDWLEERIGGPSATVLETPPHREQHTSNDSTGNGGERDAEAFEPVEDPVLQQEMKVLRRMDRVYRIQGGLLSLQLFFLLAALLVPVLLGLAFFFIVIL